MKRLTGRMYDIAAGISNLPQHKVDDYRARWESEGYELPPLSKTKKTCTACGKKSKRSAFPDTKKFGYELKAALEKRWPGVKTCPRCIALIRELNHMTRDDIVASKDRIIDDMVKRAPLEAPKLWQRFAAMVDNKLNLGETKKRLSAAYDEALANTQDRPPRAVRGRRMFRSLQLKADKVKWADATRPMVRIVPAIRTSFRKSPTLETTVKSMTDAGFEQPIVYAEPNSNTSVPGELVTWKEQKGAFQSFVFTMKDLVSRFPNNWILLCEDDVIFADGAADLVRTLNLSTEQALSLYVSNSQSRVLKGEYSTLTGDIWGSLAYLVHSTGLKKILESEVIRTWQRKDRVDRAFCQAAEEVGVKLIFKKPALADHIGETSTLVPNRTLSRGRTSPFTKTRH